MRADERRGVRPILAALALLASGWAHASNAGRDACMLADAAPENWLVRVPFDVVDGRIFVQADVNGRGPYRFAVDTGASGQARADSNLVSVLGLAVHGETANSDGVRTANADLTHLDSLGLGALIRQDLEVITRDYSKDDGFSGIIAREFFGDGLLVIDYPKRTLSFSRSLALSDADGSVLSYQRAFRVPVSLGDLQTEGNLDTGANVALVLPRSLYDQVSGIPLQRAGNGRLANGTVETHRSTLRGPFRIGNIALSDVEVRVSDRYPELLVGAHALQQAVILIDQRAKAVALCEPGREPDMARATPDSGRRGFAERLDPGMP